MSRWRWSCLEDTGAFAAALVAAGPVPAVVYLHGDLGAGKTTLAREIVRAAGYRGVVKSPTYTLLEVYPTPLGRILHLDLYRLGSDDELEFLGLRDYLDQPALWLIEWPRPGAAVLPPADLECFLCLEPDARHSLTARSASPSGEGLLGALMRALPPEPGGPS
ncbi:tRNA (adenosine(37)-N6)-threonylcarbamoyltransferase complex ATPase subunit type 1 TsaE [Acidithiobacillus caldus]|uniref:tRNA threonylcarbamoyladenosine biosynthesis protein TsaE n=1 Tax=Acidithiobacillus caldus TaxID=33059 RepID=A0A1E7YN28_9PROT|nr:tRNA (adenosine(37)-N6)-threonylcarbamoyltransferase complex ATPase subunit type 1 TsaE [Acidithiobacillus caldus]OFC35963.1 tRNA (N6-adenosine(37)-N6)-threonylcarbamoyltransferase complex ATPase TsaE [Acidithiobacillus caldus]OFC39462.1 tRNA (N6-adenosine(37)-N6)-threonylcarbamoyltransferase complex ATPase TsaE [Acidithiobacillus caldus]OFC40321.1 tRNA (N6-adenosine(37)-N6)-threonylcarbamoyltransferase complex ATPase TsaE [Acidithiobacillus caldus]